MGISKYICTYYTLNRQGDKYGITNIENILSELMQNCLEFIKEGKLHQTNSSMIWESRDPILVYRTP